MGQECTPGWQQFLPQTFHQPWRGRDRQVTGSPQGKTGRGILADTEAHLSWRTLLTGAAPRSGPGWTAPSHPASAASGSQSSPQERWT